MAETIPIYRIGKLEAHQRDESTDGYHRDERSPPRRPEPSVRGCDSQIATAGRKSKLTMLLGPDASFFHRC